MAKTFREFLYETEWYDGELLIDDLESEFSFVWDGDYRFTEEGEKKFASILDGELTSGDADAPCLEVTSTGADEELIDLFNATVAGYVADSFYQKVLTKKE